jgi:alpha,alpha-trehalase
VTTPIATGEQWDAPNGWAPIQWIAIAGLRRYGKQSLAQSIACRWTRNVVAVYRQTGKLVEKYDVMTIGRSGGGGEYPLQDGFGWTNGVTRKLLALYPACGEPAVTDMGSASPGATGLPSPASREPKIPALADRVPLAHTHSDN